MDIAACLIIGDSFRQPELERRCFISNDHGTAKYDLTCGRAIMQP